MKLYFPAIVWLLVILVLSGYSGNKLPDVAVWQFDKLVHSVIYSFLSILLLFAFTKQYKEHKQRFLLSVKVVLFAILYGGLMEILQENIFVNRDGNWYDFIANAVGAILGVLIYPLIIKFLPITKWLKIN